MKEENQCIGCIAKVKCECPYYEGEEPTPCPEREVEEFHECTRCGWRMSDIEYYSIIADVPCPRCGEPISHFRSVK